VWLTGGHAVTAQNPPVHSPRDGAEGILAARIAAYALALFSRPGDTVCDPDCADPTVVVEAVRARRHAVGIATDTHAWQTARAALTTAKTHGAPGDGMILDRPPDRWSWTGLGPLDLLLTTIGPPADPAGPHSPRGDRLATRLAGYRDLPLDRPAGRLVVVAAHHVEGGLDLASRILAAGREAGWQPVQRFAALTTAPDTRQRGAAPGRAWPVHHDVLLFRSGRQPTFPPRPPGRPPSHAVPPA
jgi:hypothetical protein